MNINTTGYIYYVKELSQNAKSAKKDTENKDNNVLDDLEKAIEFISGKNDTTTSKILQKYDFDGNGKINKSEVSFALDVNGDGKLDKKDIELAKKQDNKSRKVVTEADGSVVIYQFGLMTKKIYPDGEYRIYQRDGKGNLASSVTFRKDGTKYSEDKYVASKENLFNNKNSRPYASRTFFDENGKSVSKTEEYSYKENKDGEILKTIVTNGNNEDKTVVTMDKDRNTLEKAQYENGKVAKRTYKDGSYRIYERDKNGELQYSITYRKDGSKKSEDYYVSANKNLYNDKNSRPYAKRVFYNKNGTKAYTNKYSYEEVDGKIKKTVIRDGKEDDKKVTISTKDKKVVSTKEYKNGNLSENISYTYKTDENGNIVKTGIYKKPSNKMSVTVTDKSGNVTSESVFVFKSEEKRNSFKTNGFNKDQMDGVLEIQNYVDGKLKTTWKNTGVTEKGLMTNQREYYTYNDDGSYTVKVATYADKVKADGTVAYNSITQDVLKEYDKNGVLKTTTQYKNYNTLSDGNIKMPTYKIVCTYDENGKIIKEEKEKYEYNLKNGTKKVYKQNSNGKYEYADTENIKQERNSNNVTADDIIELASEFMGYKRTDGNQFLFGTTGHWCSAFVTYIYMELGVDLSQIRNRFSTNSIYNQAVAEGRFTTTSSVTNQKLADKLKGQMIMFGDESNGSLVHIGIVTDVQVKGNKLIIKTIEGNSKNEVKERTHEVTIKNGEITKSDGDANDGRYIAGFADFLS